MQGAKQVSGQRQFACLLSNGDAKIEQLDHAVFRNHNVRRLDIAMHNAEAMRVIKGVQDLNSQIQNLWQGG